jgi:hypothetical protein
VDGLKALDEASVMKQVRPWVLGWDLHEAMKRAVRAAS